MVCDQYWSLSFMQCHPANREHCLEVLTFRTATRGFLASRRMRSSLMQKFTTSTSTVVMSRTTWGLALHSCFFSFFFGFETCTCSDTSSAWSNVIRSYPYYLKIRIPKVQLLWTDSSVTSSSDVTRRQLLLVARRIYVLFAVIHIIQSLLAWFVRAGSI